MTELKLREGDEVSVRAVVGYMGPDAVPYVKLEVDDQSVYVRPSVIHGVTRRAIRVGEKVSVDTDYLPSTGP